MGKAQQFSVPKEDVSVPSRVRLMQQPCISAAEDLVVQKFSSNQAADLLGRACRGNRTGERKGHRGSLCEEGGDWEQECVIRE